MSCAILNTVTIDIISDKHLFRSSGYTVRFAGFMSVYEETSDENTNTSEEKDTLLPSVNNGQALDCKNITPACHFTQPPARYTEASLIKALEEKGIGRPSTYTPTITTIIQRGYVERVSKALAPTSLGEVTTSLMIDNFSEIVDYNFTANMETSLDSIEDGSSRLTDVLSKFYSGFEQQLDKAQSTVGNKSYKPAVIETDIICDKCGSKMIVKSGRFGKFAACPNYPDCKNTKPLDSSGNVMEKSSESNQPKQAPDDIKCSVCGGPMVIRTGRYGSFYACASYPKCNGTKPINKEFDIPCPLCNSKIVIRRGKNRTSFYSCSSYPSCKFTCCDTPTADKCPECNSMLLKKRNKNLYVCINKQCSYKAPVPLESQDTSN